MNIKKRFSSIVAVLFTAVVMMAGNTTTTVEQVTAAVTVIDNVDYVITSATPFTAGGSIDITNTDHAVVIISNIRPSKVIANWLKYVKINGAAAVDGSNCQVKLYGPGAIIMPYAANIRPLTVYSEQNYGGTVVNDFGLENSGGYMNTLTDAKLNNKIRSFKLKRGYMVTFSTRASGRGYSRCFIADKEDLEFASLPKVLDQKISSYRVFKWYDSQKKGLASDTRELQNAMLVSTWCYDWAQGNADRLPDVEWVPNHIYEDWPSSATCGSVTQSCHMKTNNEPGNAADDRAQTVDEVLANWENLMRTGMRLCSESSHDGSLGHLEAFIDSIDARGWRCDILDLHCYWPKDNFFNWKYWYERFGNRPIWISEWVVGASWNNNGIFATDRTTSAANLALNKSYLQDVIPSLNSSPYVERYAYWNSEADVSKLIIDETMTPAGEYYASVNTAPSYNRAYEKIPVTPKMKAPSGLKAAYDKKEQKVELKWNEANGEYNQLMVIQRQRTGSSLWVTVDTIAQKEEPANYTVAIDGYDGDNFRISVTDIGGYVHTSNTATAVNENLEYGDAVTVVVGSEVTQKYLGGNIFVNGDFEMGLYDWQSGTGEQLAAPYFQAVPVGSMDGSAYLQCYGNSSSQTSNQSIIKTLPLEKNTSYYVGATVSNANSNNQRILTGTSLMGIYRRLTLPSTADWAKTAGTFTTANDTILYVQFLSTNAEFRVDDIILCRLFDTKDEALADAKACMLEKVKAFKAYNTVLPRINTLLDATVNEVGVTHTDIMEALENALSALDMKDICDELSVPLQTASEYRLVPRAEAAAKFEAVKNITQTSLAAYIDDIKALKEMLSAAFNGAPLDGAVKSPSFATAGGWETKTGTYTGGDQRLATQAGKTCWNAWWALSAAGNATASMAIRQEITGLEQGLYSLRCLASTQHLCETDQHAFMVVDGTTKVSPSLKYGLLDLEYLPADLMWNSLSTPYAYVPAGDTITIGFIGTKQGAVDKQWIRFGDAAHTGDNREGWWCATDFVLDYIPVHLANIDESGWGTICLAKESTAPEGFIVYSVAGIAADSSYVGLQETDGKLEAGYPYVVKADAGSSNLLTLSGEAVTSAKTNVNGLRGVLKASQNSKYQLNALVLTNGVWNVITERYPMTANTAYIREIKNMPVLAADWVGVKLPISGKENLPSGINGVIADDGASVDAPAFNLGGQKVDGNAKGIIIKNNRKVIVK